MTARLLAALRRLLHRTAPEAAAPLESDGWISDLAEFPASDPTITHGYSDPVEAIYRAGLARREEMAARYRAARHRGATQAQAWACSHGAEVAR